MLIDRSLIQQAKEKLKDKNATIIAETLELDDFDTENLKSKCCFHNEKTASFIYNPKKYSFHCFGCQKNADIIDAFMHKGSTYIEAVQKLFELAEIKHSFGELKIKTKHQYKYPKEVICDNKNKVYDYYGKRKISKETLDYADVRQDEHGNAVFNYYDTNDVLTMVKYRPSRKIEKGENKMWCQKDADTTPLLFNMNRININEPLLICEGEGDCLSAIESGYINAVSVPLGAGNYGWIEENLEWLDQFDQIIICSDNDEAGMKMQKEAIYRLGSWKTRVVDIPRLYEKENSEKIPIKDLNEVLYWYGKEKVIDIIVNAKDTPVNSVVDFADIKRTNLEDTDGIKTGIKLIDKHLMRFFYGTFTILTGINGAGKTSFLSQVICQSMEQNKNVFFYSAELSNELTKNWISYILTGQRHLKQYANEDDALYWRTTKDVENKLDQYYKQKLYIYKDDLSRKAEDIFISMEDNVRKYGVKLLILDNLTTINLGNNDNNKFEKQAELISNLIAFAKKFNVAVVLVVHPHKMDMTRRMNIMDLQGAMAMSDLTHRVLSLYRVQPDDKKGVPKKNGQGWFKEPIKYDVILDILKDRLKGMAGKSIGLYYDMPSRRFFTNMNDLDYRYGWDDEEYKGDLPFPPKQLFDNTNEVFGSIKNE